MSVPGSLVSGVHHVSLLVDDLTTAVRFYRDVLGCEQIPRPDLGFPGVWLRTGHCEVHLLCADRSDGLGTTPTVLSPLANHVAFTVSDLDEAVVVLTGLGHTVRSGVAGLRQAFVQDPSGNIVELSAGPSNDGGVR